MADNIERTDTGENEVIIEDTVDAEDVPFWTTGNQTDGELFQNLNLDGIGDFDDEAYVSIYQFGDYEEKITVVSIHLGTGSGIRFCSECFAGRC